MRGAELGGYPLPGETRVSSSTIPAELSVGLPGIGVVGALPPCCDTSCVLNEVNAVMNSLVILKVRYILSVPKK